MSCDNYDLANLLHDSTLPDPDFVHLIGQALHEGQIDSERAEMAYAYMRLKLGNGYCMNVQ
jgi:hypothetical protein